jgi:thioredoxin 1
MQMTRKRRAIPVSISRQKEVPYVTATRFDRLVIESPIPVLVNFETPWSKGMVPLLGQLAEAFAGRLRVVRVNIFADPAVAVRFKIRAVPTLLMFKNGVPVEFIVGTVPSRFVFETVGKALGGHPKAIKARRMKTARTARQWPWRRKFVPDSTFA